MIRSTHGRLFVLLCAAFGALLSAQARAADSEWQRRLARDLVRQEAESWVYDEYSLCELTPRHAVAGEPASSSFRIRSHSSAPRAAISRDMFVTWTTIIENTYQIMLESRGSLRCRSIPAPSGKVDLALSVRMTAEGYQAEWFDARANELKRSAQLWSEVYPESQPDAPASVPQGEAQAPAR